MADRHMKFTGIVLGGVFLVSVAIVASIWKIEFHSNVPPMEPDLPRDYRQKGMLRIVNGEPDVINHLQIKYDGKSVVIEELRPDQMFRLPIETGYPVKVEYIYSYADHEEYRVGDAVHQAADMEFEVILKREGYDHVAFGPINLDYPLGISPLEHIVMNIDYEYSGSKDELEELKRWLEKNRR